MEQAIIGKAVDLLSGPGGLASFLRHRKDGGPTSVKDCALFCFFHHQVVIHRWGWPSS